MKKYRYRMTNINSALKRTFNCIKPIVPKSVRHFFVKTRLFDFFTNVAIETTTVCNRKCPYCPHAYIKREEAFMDTSLFKHIINELAKINYTGTITPSGSLHLSELQYAYNPVVATASAIQNCITQLLCKVTQIQS